jgi:Mce-associated membrane protein
VLLVLGFLVLAFFQWRATREITESEDAARVVRASVADKVEALLSYDYKTFDDDLAAAQKGMTSDFQDEYDPTVAEIRDRALAQKRSQQADVAAVAVVSKEPDEVTVLVFVDTTSSRAGHAKQKVMQNRVTVTMVKQGDTWLIDELSVPQS